MRPTLLQKPSSILASVVLLCFSLLQCGDLGKPNEFAFNLSRPIALFFVRDTALRPYLVIANRGNSSISIYDLDKSKFLDTFPMHREIQPIYTGGRMIAVKKWQQKGNTLTLIIASTLNRKDQITQLEIDLGLKPKYRFVDIGDRLLAPHQTASFIDSGRSSNPYLNDIEIDPEKSGDFLYRIRYSGNRGYLVTAINANGVYDIGTAVEGTPFVSTENGIRFTIIKGKYETTEGDYFAFKTIVIKPLILDENLVDMFVQDRKIFLLTSMNGSYSLKAFDLTNRKFAEKLDISAIAKPGRCFIDKIDEQTHLYINDQASGELVDHLFDNSKAEAALSEIRRFSGIGSPLSVLSYEKLDYLFVLDNDRRSPLLFNSSTGMPIEGVSWPTIETPITAIGMSPEQVPEDTSYYEDFTKNTPVFFLATKFGELYPFNPTKIGKSGFQLDNIEHSEGSESDFLRSYAVFRDNIGDGENISKPKMELIATKDGITRNENWVVSYEGDIPNSSAIGTFDGEGNLSSSSLDFRIIGISLRDVSEDQQETADRPARPRTPIDPDYRSDLPDPDPFSVPSASRSNSSERLVSVNRSDAIVFDDPANLQQIVSIESIIDAHTLKLDWSENMTPDLLVGKQVRFFIRANNSYTVYGTSSGFQANRAIEDVLYVSDSGAVTFRINSTPINVTTTSDAFIFDTYDGNDPISVGTSPSAMVFGTVDDKRLLFIANEASNTVSVVSLKNFAKYSPIIQR